MKRTAETMDEKDWIILRLARLIARNTPALKLHNDFVRTLVWASKQLDFPETRYGAAEMLRDEDIWHNTEIAAREQRRTRHEHVIKWFAENYDEKPPTNLTWDEI